MKPMRMRHFLRCAWLAVPLAATVSCGDVSRSSRSPVLLVVNSLQSLAKVSANVPNSTLLSDVYTTASTVCLPGDAPCILTDAGAASLIVIMKDVTVTAPSSNNSVTVLRYHITYRRSDGRNTEGVDVPYAFDGAATATIKAGDTAVLINIEIVRSEAKREAPLVQLKASQTVISTIADITFYGRDEAGNDVSVTGQMLIDFGDFPG